MQKVKPKKSLGQHFLTDLSVADRIAATLNDFVDVPVVEVGPGMGVLTEPLLKTHPRLKVAEIDTESIDYLRQRFPKLEAEGGILHADFLHTDLRSLFPDSNQLCVIGNYPYNISSQIFFHVLDYKDLVVCCSGMLQKEVAERLAAKPGTKARGILSVLLQRFYVVDYLFTVDEHVFNPPPKVKSGVVKMVRRPSDQILGGECNETLFKTIVKTTFGQRRKTIRNSIRSLLPPGASCPETPLMAMRPEQLEVEQFVELTNLIEQLRSQS